MRKINIFTGSVSNISINGHETASATITANPPYEVILNYFFEASSPSVYVNSVKYNEAHSLTVKFYNNSDGNANITVGALILRGLY
ncbi:hypothetical protein ICA_05745 [Bacillus cereus BAG1O-3]|uniref:hypothetical protein n=1 Tax=Bacillus thuringiensis TaxID=1428 RepID=UPI0003530BE1|nr:hypothetical protein [Bacillus thuringiensis]EPF08348.1 hypothetical protein ICA_05745 [Bacillus cereus BAG1O-3]